jgi:hypothetical protein
MSLFLQYQLGQAMHDLAHGDGGGGDGGGSDAAGAGFGFGLGFMMPWLLARAMPRWTYRPLPPPTVAALPAATPRFCGECGGTLLAQARYCGHCGQPVWRPAR